MKKLQEQLFSKLNDTGWDEKLRFFLLSSDFTEILEWLQYEVEEKRRFTPAIKDILNPFIYCPLDKLKVVFLLPQPYLDPTLNSGLALGCLESARIPIEFYRLREQLLKEFPNVKFEEQFLKGDLIKWANQGVLLLNVTPTTRITQPGHHKKTWASFTSYVFDVLNRMESMIFVAFGECELNKIDSKHYKIQLEPLPSSQDTKWECAGLFSKINNILEKKGLKKLNW